MGTLPFDARAQLVQRPDTIIDADVPCAIWPAPGRATAAGVHYDHEGEAPLRCYDDLAVANRVLRVGATEYVIVNAVPHRYFPHVALRLRASEGARN